MHTYLYIHVYVCNNKVMVHTFLCSKQPAWGEEPSALRFPVCYCPIPLNPKRTLVPTREQSRDVSDLCLPSLACFSSSFWTIPPPCHNYVHLITTLSSSAEGCVLTPSLQSARQLRAIYLPLWSERCLALARVVLGTQRETFSEEQQA